MKQLLSIVLMLSLVLMGCDTRSTSPGITDEEILIGNIQDLSGPIKELGFLIPAGSQLYFDYVNEKGGVHGRKIRMVTGSRTIPPIITSVAPPFIKLDVWPTKSVAPR